MQDKVLRRLQATVQKASKALAAGEGFDGHSDPYIKEARLELRTDNGMVFGFELELENKDVIGNMAVFQENGDGDLIPLDMESLQMMQEDAEQQHFEEMRLKLN
jgi:hypothetical protein